MQQTEKYKLNLIERTDTFSPDALNENTQKVEEVLYTALAGEETARTAADTALTQRITALEAHHVVVGTYTGTGVGRTLDMGFTPAAVWFVKVINGASTILTVHNPVVPWMSDGIFKIVEGGAFIDETYTTWNEKDAKYFFIAIA